MAELDLRVDSLPRATLERALHCVTTWSHLHNRWTGVRFRDVFARVIQDSVDTPGARAGLVFFGQDGYRTSLPLEDVLHEDVLLATELNGAALDTRHGAPVRLIAPAHYGYKNLKHLERIEYHSQLPRIKRGIRALLDHPRARVALEERGRWVPGRVLRYLYRPFIARTAATFEGALLRHTTQEAPDEERDGDRQPREP
ncbi:MAG: molybdopterin-dependent oxidoreductase [Pseudomonadota bacterium]